MYPLPTHAGSFPAAIHAAPSSHGYHPPDGSMDDSEESSSVDEQPGGVQLPSSPDSSDAGVPEGMQGVTSFTTTYHPPHGSVFGFPAHFYTPPTWHLPPALPAAHTAEASSVNQTIPSIQSLSVQSAPVTPDSAPTQMVPPYQIPANPFSPANTDDFTAFQLHYALTADDLTPGDEDPFVERHEHGLPVHRFLNRWRELGGFDPSIGAVGAEASRVREWERPATIARDELQGDRYDIQGINWTRLETTRAMARKARRRLYPYTAVGVENRAPPVSYSFFRYIIGRANDVVHGGDVIRQLSQVPVGYDTCDAIQRSL